MKTEVYGITENGNAEVRISLDLHATLSCGGGKPGQSYPCVLVIEYGTEDSDNPK